MSVEVGGDSAGVWSVGRAPREADRQVITSLYDSYAAHLFDYCLGMLRDPAAAADAVQDTLIAADALIGKLRDPEQLRVWLYCIARLQCLSELPRGSETFTPDELFAGRPGEGTAEFEFADVDADAAALAKETLLVVTAALDGLSDEDAEVVSLVYRHGIDGADLATVLGVSGRRAEALLSGAGTRFEESSDAVSVLRAPGAPCPVLETTAGEWDPVSPRLTPELRKRLTRHIGSCDDCSRSRGDIFGPELLGAMPLAVLPAEFREQVTSTVFDTEPGSYRRSVTRRVGKLDDTGFPVPAPSRRNLPKAMAASAALAVVVVGALAFHHLTGASAAGSKQAAAVASGSPTQPSSSVPATVPVIQKGHKHGPKPFPGQLGPTPTPTPAPSGLLPAPTPTGPSPSPTPTHSKKPTPKPSKSKSPTPTPTPTTPTPTPTTPTPTPTTPTPTPTTPTP